jgi:hypothetical protein
LTVVLSLALASSATAHADTKGDWIQTDTLGMNMYSYNFDKSAATDVTDAQNLSEFVGLHYYFIDHVRVGMNLQFTERLDPDPASGTSRFQTFALLPQIGWNFYNPFFAALVVTIAPWTAGKSLFDDGFQGVLGASTKLTSRVRGNLAVEIPVNLHQATTIGITPLVGISVGL